MAILVPFLRLFHAIDTYGWRLHSKVARVMVHEMNTGEATETNWFDLKRGKRRWNKEIRIKREIQHRVLEIPRTRIFRKIFHFHESRSFYLALNNNTFVSFLYDICKCTGGTLMPVRIKFSGEFPSRVERKLRISNRPRHRWSSEV